MSFLLPPPPQGWQGPTEVVSSLSGWPYQRTIEPAGRRFAAFLKKKTGEFHEEEENKQEETGNADQDAAFSAKMANKHKTWSKEKAEDYYELVGLGDLRWRANAEEIKASYRKMILIYHPDKMKAASEKNQEVNDEIFKSIQKAYDVLSDPKKRRAYDSTEEFDDSIPSERQADREDFFKLFEPIFERNARWSNIQPAPKIGDPNTPYEQVKKFYDFWWEFKSWRGFRHPDEYDLEQAESSDERRWMNKQNEKLSAPLVRQERARLLKLSELAYKKDPRVRKYENDKEEEKKKKKNAKKDERRLAQEAVDKQIAAEKQKKEDEEKAKIAAAIEAKKNRDKEIKAFKRKQKRLRDLCRSLPTPPSEEHIDYICNKLSAEQLGDLHGAMSPPDSPATRTPFDEMVSSMKNAEKEKENKQREEDAARKANLNRPWNEEELSNLAKGLAKFPGGLSNRWELIADLLPTRTPKEIATKVKEVKSSQMCI
jgi:DnaJ family protein C protein 2